MSGISIKLIPIIRTQESISPIFYKQFFVCKLQAHLFSSWISDYYFMAQENSEQKLVNVGKIDFLGRQKQYGVPGGGGWGLKRPSSFFQHLFLKPKILQLKNNYHLIKQQNLFKKPELCYIKTILAVNFIIRHKICAVL